MAFDLASCVIATNSGGIDAWIDRYLSAGPWANEGLRNGLRLQRRIWIGPLRVSLTRLERCCGPEPAMEYVVPAEHWERDIAGLAERLRDPAEVPPLIVEWRSGTLSVRDGNHRAAAMLKAGWTHCWIVVWCNSLSDYESACATIGMPGSMPSSGGLSQHMRRDGWVRLPGAVDPPLVRGALSAVTNDLAHHFDPRRQVDYDNISYCPGLRGTASILDLLIQSPARHYLDDWLGWDALAHDGGQIAIRRARNADRPYPPVWHIDGVGSGKNGLAIGSPISNFTVLVGVYLTPVAGEFAGNFTVWPGSHLQLQSYFRQHGPTAMFEGKPKIDLGESVQLPAMPGDVIIAHYQLAHTAAVNLSCNDRIAVYFRLWLRDIEERRWELLTNIWTGWRL